MTLPRPYGRKLKAAYLCILICVGVSNEGDEPAVQHHANPDASAQSKWSALGLLTLSSPSLCPLGFGGNGGLRAGGALVALSAFREHGATPPLSGKTKSIRCAFISRIQVSKSAYHSVNERVREGALNPDLTKRQNC